MTFDAFETPTQEWARAIRHIAEELAGGGNIAETVDALHALAEDLDPGGMADLEAYCDDDNAT